MDVALTAVGPDDWRRWRALRLAALATSPEAFGSRPADWQGAGEERWRERLADVAYNLVADLDGEPAGLASVTAPDGDGASRVLSLWVAPAARGRGVGEALLEALIAWAREHGARDVELAVREGNAPAIALYVRLGFVDAGPEPRPPGTLPERRMRLAR